MSNETNAYEHVTHEYDYYYYGNFTYEYEIDDTLPLKEFVPVATIYSLIGLLGLVGNLLVIFAISRGQRMRSITNLFLLSLASADLLLVVVCVPIKCIAFFSYTWKLGEVMCKVVNYIQTVSMVCSALTLTVMSVERFVAIRYPLKARSVCTIRHARIVILSVWVTSFIAAIPIIFGIEYRTVGDRVPANWCHKYWGEKPTFGKVYETYMLTIILVIPVSVMLVTYTWISTIIWHVATRRADMRSGSCVSTTSETQTKPNQLNPTWSVPITAPIPASSQVKAYMDDDRTRKQVVMMLMVVVILFAVCWTPVLVNNVLVAFNVLDYLNMGWLKTMRMIFHLLSYANSCVNPFVYAFMSKTFRDGFKQSICTCVRGPMYMRKKQMSTRSTTTSTRASSQGGEKSNDQRSDSVGVRRPSEMDGHDIKQLLLQPKWFPFLHKCAINSNSK